MGTKHLISRPVRALRGAGRPWSRSGSARSRASRPAPRTVVLLLLLAGLLLAGGGVAASALTPEPRGGPPTRGDLRSAQPARVEPRGLERSAPVRLLIPKIEVEAEVVPLTLEEGVLTAPSRADAAGWYEGGTSPGEPGSAVIVGLGRRDYGDPAVFAGLDRLAAGDPITVVRENGSRVAFTVDRVVTDGRDEPVYRGGGGAELRLVQWPGAGPEAHTRLVVFATFAA